MTAGRECFHFDNCLLKREKNPRFVSEIVRSTYAVVLAGGRGSRLRQLTDWRAKPAVPFGGKLRIIDFPLSNCVNSGVRRIGVVTQYKAHSLIRHIRHGWSFLPPNLNEFIDVLPAQQRLEESWYQGTADAVYQNLDILHCDCPAYVLILGGDHVYKMDYGRLLADHVAKGADLTVACIDVPLDDAKYFGVMQVDERERITDFQEKPEHPTPLPGHTDKALASMGIYVFTAQFLYDELRRDAQDGTSNHDFGKDLIPYLVPRARVYAHRFATSCVNLVGDLPYWRDVGTIDAYWEANLDLTQVVPDLNLYDDSWPIWSAEQQFAPAKFVFDDDGHRGQAWDSLVSGGCIVSGATVRRSLLSTKVRVESYAYIEDSVILPEVVVGRRASLRRAVVDKRCRLPDGLTVGENPDEDRRRFYVTEKGVTLITPEMLGQERP
ncbi:MAG TPA: glucose-1-phosphate adenylyltransferase [Methylococcaceae bacterium]|nr:glucose-1-phosphate adenylyltransferase [Methylococcaceae bacterium]